MFLEKTHVNKGRRCKLNCNCKQKSHRKISSVFIYMIYFNKIRYFIYPTQGEIRDNNCNFFAILLSVRVNPLTKKDING